MKRRFACASSRAHFWAIGQLHLATCSLHIPYMASLQSKLQKSAINAGLLKLDEAWKDKDYYTVQQVYKALYTRFVPPCWLCLPCIWTIRFLFHVNRSVYWALLCIESANSRNSLAMFDVRGCAFNRSCWRFIVKHLVTSQGRSLRNCVRCWNLELYDCWR